MRIRMVALTLVAATLVVVSPAAGAQEVETRPNVIVIMTDDMRADLLTPKYMPSTYELLSSEGMMFTNAVSNIPNCCPARASFLTGLLPRHHQVWVNVIKDSLGNSGGHGLFKELFESTGSYLPCWLEEAGYSTMLAGKYLNEYPFGQPKTFKENLYVPPCWTEWYGMNYAKSSSEDPVIPGSGGLLYKRYLNHDEVVLNQHGRVRFVRWRSSSDNPYLKAGKADGTRSMARPSGEITRKKNVKSVYATDVVTNRTRSFIRRKSEAGQPFFAFVSMYAPHMGAYPHPADALDPVDVCALKPGLADRLHGGAPEFLTTGDNTFWSDTPCDPARRFYGQPADQTNPNDVVGNQVMALRRVDRAVTRIVDELKAAGTFDNTYLVFMSDQGLTWGERGMLASKQWPYSEAIRIPFGVVGPSIQPRFTNAVVSTIDLAPTILGWAGTSQNDHVFDGVDFGQYLHGLGPKPRAAIIEMPRKLIKGQLLLPAWVATWSAEFHIVDYNALDPITGNDNREVFDLHLDPFETRNLWSPDN